MTKLSNCHGCSLPGFWSNYPVRKDKNIISFLPFCPVCAEKKKLNDKVFI